MRVVTMAVFVWLMGCGQAVSVRFNPVFGDAPFSCTTTARLGTTSTVFTPRDFRLYLHDFELLDAAGHAEPLSLVDDGAFQGKGVVLLDFEDGTGECANTGTSATHLVVTGQASHASSAGLRFSLGVPFALNHADATAAQPPLNSTAMWWSWLAGYKFLRLEGTTTGLPTGVNVHVGSVGCQPGATPNSVQSCDADNVVTVTLDGFDVAKDTVSVDAQALLSGSDLDHNADSTAPGCMGSLQDPDCAPIFERLGLPFGSTSATPQTFFRRQ